MLKPGKALRRPRRRANPGLDGRIVDKPPVAGKPSQVEAADPEVPEKAERRRFNAEYQRSILTQADDCRSEGAIGAQLRQEGL